MPNWKWAVIYNDGTEQVETDGAGFGTVKMADVRALVVFDKDDSTKQYCVTIAEGMRPIFFRRKRHLQINDPETIPIEYIQNDELVTEIIFATVLGWQKTVNGQNVKSLIWLLHDGSVAITDRDLDEL